MSNEIKVMINTTDDNLVFNGVKDVTLNEEQLSGLINEAILIVKGVDREFDQESIDCFIEELRESLKTYGIYDENADDEAVDIEDINHSPRPGD